MTSFKKICSVLMVMCLLTSCGGFKDIDKRFFVTQMGVDLTDNKEKPYKVSLKLAIPKPQIEPGKEQFQFIQETGPTIGETVRLMKSLVDKELDFGQTKVILFGEKLARKDINDVLDWIERRRDIQMVSYLAVASPDAETVLKIKPKSERLAGNALFLSFGQEGTETAYIATEYLFDFYRRKTTDGLSPFMPVVEARTDELYNIRKVAIFDKKRLKAIFDVDETRIFNEMASNVQKFVTTTKVKDIKLVLSFQNLKVSHKIITPKQGKPYVQMKVKGSAIVEEANKTVVNKDWKTYEKETSRTVEKQYLKLLKKMQKLNLDPVGFGEDYFASHSNGSADLKAWQKLYPQIDFRVKANIRIKNSGNIH